MSARTLVLAAATVLAGLSAGFFFTYQASVTLALAEVDDATYVATFQAVNETVRNPWFALVFFGAPPATAAALIVHRRAPTLRLLVGAGLTLVVATVMVTAVVNVPLNDDLAAVDDRTALEATAARAAFEDGWNLGNLVRTVSSSAGFVCLVAACVTVRSRRSSGDGAGPPGAAAAAATS
jgi:uncharacterized membrane protein